MITPKKVHGVLIALSGRGRPELAVELVPGQPNRPLEAERPVVDPLIQIETDRGPPESLEDVHVQRNLTTDGRLEELGIMKYVHTISAVSGGSIIAAYYVIEMEKRLRRRREELAEDPDSLDKIRLQVFEDIAGCFFQALDHNLRSRAMVFSPFYHHPSMDSSAP